MDDHLRRRLRGLCLPLGLVGLGAALAGLWGTLGLCLLLVVSLLVARGPLVLVIAVAVPLLLAAALGALGFATYFLPASWPGMALMMGSFALVTAAVLVWLVPLSRDTSRAQGRAARIREAEWRFVGRDFAQGHAKGQRLGSTWFIVAWMVVQYALGVGLYAVLVQDMPEAVDQHTALGAGLKEALGGDGKSVVLMLAATMIPLGTICVALGWWGVAALGAIYAGAIALLIARSPGARMPVTLLLLIGLPFSLPALMHWFHGERPNLIYRWRIARLLPAADERGQTV